MIPSDAPPALVADDVEQARRLAATNGWAVAGHRFPGCGCGESSKGLWFDVPEFVFHDDCCLHDYLYNLGGTEADRKSADDSFYRAMKLRAGPDPLWRMMAWIYYRAVRQFGKRFYNYRS